VLYPNDKSSALDVQGAKFAVLSLERKGRSVVFGKFAFRSNAGVESGSGSSVNVLSGIFTGCSSKSTAGAEAVAVSWAVPSGVDVCN
jgi:hypothetical protein